MPSGDAYINDRHSIVGSKKNSRSNNINAADYVALTQSYNMQRYRYDYYFVIPKCGC